MIFHLILFFSVILLITSPSSTSAQRNCNRVCRGAGNGVNTVSYPFGFGDGCEIRLDCSPDGEIRVGEYTVRNLTRDYIMINLPVKCDRPFDEILRFSNTNFALTSRNGLLLENCSSALSGCAVSTTIVENHFSTRQCNTTVNRTMNCYSEDGSRDEFIDLTELNAAGCQILFSSVTVESNGNFSQSSPVSLEFQSLELGWWVHGECSCDGNAFCQNVSRENQTVGYRCHCKEGYDGDGFTAGDGCRRVSKCDASRYMSGDCGGTTRVGVLIGGIIAGASLMSTVALIFYCLRKRAASRNQKSARRQFSEATASFSVPFYPYKDLERATNSFSEKQRLGVGAYGTVYAGKLTTTNEWVAVKKLRHRETDGNDQVMNEIKLISTVNHPNLVRLLGCCIERGEQILVYEFMPNGTLSQHLQKERGKGLPWTVRLTIATETAHAIAHLHSMNPPIYHRDIKSSNILLDHNYNSKVADFGLSRLGMLDDSHISTAPQGTPGYVDPQYHQNFHLSDKSDVYSFGVVLLEIITALKVVDFSRSHTEINLAALAIDRIGKGCVDDIIDTFLDPNKDAWTLSSIHKVAELAFRCLAFHRDMRPSMTEVAGELEEIRMSGWNTGDDNMTVGSSSVVSLSSSPYNASEKSIGGTIIKKVAGVAAISSRRLSVISDCLSKTDKDQNQDQDQDRDGSPVSIQDPWLSEQSSPSTNSLLGNIVR